MKTFLRALLTIAVVFALGVQAKAATTPNSMVTPQTPTRGIVQFLQGTDVAGTYKTLYTAGSNGSRCYGMWMNTNDNTATHGVVVQIVSAAIKYGGATVTTVLGAGFFNGVPSQPLMNSTVWPGLPIDSYGNPYLQLISGDTIQVTYLTALTASTVINVVVSCSDF